MRKALFFVVSVCALFAFAGSTPTAPPPLEEMVLAGFPAVSVEDLVQGAQPRTNPIPHVSPERFENSLLVITGQDGGTLTMDGRPPVVSHVLPDAGSAPLAIETHRVILSGGTFTYEFATAFAGIPTCVCSDIATTAAACSASGTTTAQVVLKGGATATLDVICVGVR